MSYRFLASGNLAPFSTILRYQDKTQEHVEKKGEDNNTQIVEDMNFSMIFRTFTISLYDEGIKEPGKFSGMESERNREEHYS